MTWGHSLEDIVLCCLLHTTSSLSFFLSFCLYLSLTRSYFFSLSLFVSKPFSVIFFLHLCALLSLSVSLYVSLSVFLSLPLLSLFTLPPLSGFLSLSLSYYRCFLTRKPFHLARVKLPDRKQKKIHKCFKSKPTAAYNNVRDVSFSVISPYFISR